jgi:hypothetical protein
VKIYWAKVSTILVLKSKMLHRQIGAKASSETQSLSLAEVIEKLPVDNKLD